MANAVQAALEKAALRAARVAEEDALRDDDGKERAPGKEQTAQLDHAKEQSRSDGNLK